MQQLSRRRVPIAKPNTIGVQIVVALVANFCAMEREMRETRAHRIDEYEKRSLQLTPPEATCDSPSASLYRPVHKGDSS